MINIITNGIPVYNKGIINVHLPRNHNTITIHYKITNDDDVVSGPIGATYSINIQHLATDFDTPLLDRDGEEMVDIDLSPLDTPVDGYITINSNTRNISELTGGVSYNFIFEDDNAVGDTTIEAWVETTFVEVNTNIVPVEVNTPTKFLEGDASNYALASNNALGMSNTSQITFTCSFVIKHSWVSGDDSNEVWLFHSKANKNWQLPSPVALFLNNSSEGEHTFNFTSGEYVYAAAPKTSTIDSVEVFLPFTKYDILFSYDSSSGVGVLYVNDAPYTLNVTRAQAHTITLGSIKDMGIGIAELDNSTSYGPGNYSIDTCINNYSFNDGYIDFTIEGNRRKFFEANGDVVDGGADGSTAYGSQPYIWCPDGRFDNHTGLIAPLVARGTFRSCPSALTITSTAPSEAIGDGGTYSYIVTTTPVNDDETVTITSTTLPSWLTFIDNGDGTAILSGIHDSVGDGPWNIDITATTDYGISDSQSISVLVYPISSYHLEQDSNDFYLDDAAAFDTLVTNDVMTFVGRLKFTLPSSYSTVLGLFNVSDSGKCIVERRHSNSTLSIYIGDVSQPQLNSTQTVLADTFYNVLISVNTSTQTAHMYIDDVDVLVAPSGSWSSLDFTGLTQASSGTWGGLYNEGNLCLSDFSFNNQYIDFSIEGNRRKFFEANGDSVDGGADGSTAYGSQPMIWSPNGKLDEHSGHFTQFTARGTTINPCP